MSFLESPWFIFPILAAGSWLGYGLYLRSAAVLNSRWRWTLATFTFLAWIAMAGLLLQPLWILINPVYHPPAVVIAVDESPSYAAGGELRAEETVQRSMKEVREFYRARGFRILDCEFAERARTAGSVEDLGILTSQASLRNHLDSLAIPNLRGVFVWTDGRWNADTAAGVNAWPAPVFPVPVQGTLREVQGENVKAEFSDPDSGADVSVDWRSLGGVGHGAQLELRSGAGTFHREFLPNPDALTGVKLRHRFHLSAQALQGVGEKWTALIRPERKSDNFTEKNDTVGVVIQGLHREREVFLRPLRSLEERGLMDALFASDSLEVGSVVPDSLAAALRNGGVLWARSQFASLAMACGRKTGAPVILYAVPGEPGGRTASFTSSAHVVWRGDAERFFPGGVLSLADLGVNASGWELSEPDSSLEAIAWAEEGVRRGLLFARHKDATTPVFEFAPPPIWSSQFHPGADERIRRLQERWVQGVSEWTRINGAPVHVSTPPPAVSRPPMDVEMSRIGVDVENLSALATATHGEVLEKAEAPDAFLATLPDLPRGQTEERNSKSRPLFPPGATSLIVISLLCSVWALRKKLHLD